MRIVLISNEMELVKILQSSEYISDHELVVLNSNPKPLNIISSLLNTNISLLILDDDFVTPESAAILSAIKKVSPEVAIIFITSNASIELGSEISQLGIQYYALKPITHSTFCESIKSITKKQLNTTQ